MTKIRQHILIKRFQYQLEISIVRNTLLFHVQQYKYENTYEAAYSWNQLGYTLMGAFESLQQLYECMQDQSQNIFADFDKFHIGFQYTICRKNKVVYFNFESVNDSLGKKLMKVEKKLENREQELVSQQKIIKAAFQEINKKMKYLKNLIPQKQNSSLGIDDSCSTLDKFYKNMNINLIIKNQEDDNQRKTNVSKQNSQKSQSKQIDKQNQKKISKLQQEQQRTNVFRPQFNIFEDTKKSNQKNKNNKKQKSLNKKKKSKQQLEFENFLKQQGQEISHDNSQSNQQVQNQSQKNQEEYKSSDVISIPDDQNEDGNINQSQNQLENQKRVREDLNSHNQFLQFKKSFLDYDNCLKRQNQIIQVQKDQQKKKQQKNQKNSLTEKIQRAINNYKLKKTITVNQMKDNSVKKYDKSLKQSKGAFEQYALDLKSKVSEAIKRQKNQKEQNKTNTIKIRSKKKALPTCGHPQRQIRAKGMCSKCYSKQYMKQKNKILEQNKGFNQGLSNNQSHCDLQRQIQSLISQSNSMSVVIPKYKYQKKSKSCSKDKNVLNSSSDGNKNQKEESWKPTNVYDI